MPDASLPPLPPPGQAPWRSSLDLWLRRLPVHPSPALVGLAAVTVVVIVAAALVLVRATRPPAPAALPSAVPAPAEPAGPAPLSASGREEDEKEVVVDVAGAVARPGLVHLRSGARVAEAVAAAGGATAEADLPALNQARVVTDGEQVRVPRVGEPPPPPPAPAGPGRAAGPGAAGGPVDLNRATPAELDALPGVGPATAAAIITWRDENGGFRRVEDLLEVPGIGPARLERLRPHVRV